MEMEPEVEVGEFRWDRTAFSVVALSDSDDAVQYWLSRPVEERLRALELLRRTFYGGAYAQPGLQRVVEVVQLERAVGQASWPV